MSDSPVWTAEAGAPGAPVLTHFRRTPILAWDTLQLAAIVLVITVVVGSAVGYYRVAVSKAKQTEAFYLAGDVQDNLTEEYFLTGDWPDREAFESMAYIYPTDHVRGFEYVAPGAFDVIFNPGVGSQAGGERLTYRAALSPTDLNDAIVWTCADYPPPGGRVALGPDKTDLPEHLRPWQCRTGARP